MNDNTANLKIKKINSILKQEEAISRYKLVDQSANKHFN